MLARTLTPPDRPFTSKRFALADALDRWRVQGIDLAAALAALLLQHAPGQEQRPYERFPQIFIPDDG